MKYTGPIFRPPPEANTLLLQVTVGCSHNNCSFCTMYRETPFAIEDMAQIEQDLQEARQNHAQLQRIFLVNGDPFVLPAGKLKEIAGKIIEYFPEMETISMYASIRNIRHKSDAELAELRALRINDLWVGVESGSEAVLRHLNKGFSVDSAREQLGRLHDAGIRHNGIYMLGVAGRGGGIGHAAETAKLINETKPQLVGVTSLGIFDTSPLAAEVANGTFIQATEGEILEEERALIAALEVDDLFFFGDHPLNAVPISGVIPEDRQQMLEALDFIIDHTDPSILASTAPRHTL